VSVHWFRPNQPKQLAFVSCWEAESCYAGGVGSGKTLSGGFKALLASLDHPGTVGLVGRQSYRALEDTTKKVLLDGDDKPPVIPPEAIADRSEGDNKVTLHNGSEILFRSFQDFNIEKLLSLNLGWFYVDEATETTERIWLTLLGRLRHPAGPRCGWATTNPNGHDWLWRRFHPDGGQAEGALFVSRTEDNPDLAPDYVRRLRTMPKEWQKRFVDASFDTAAGQIWDEWDRSVHVVPWFEIPYNWNRVESLDHGRRNPTAYLQAATDYDGNLIVTDGYYEPGLVAQHAAAILMLRGNRDIFSTIVADPSCFVQGPNGRAVAQMYAEHDLHLKAGSNSVEPGLLRVSEWLTRREGEPFPEWHPYAGTLGPDRKGAPRLYVADIPGTADLRREIPDYRWRDLSPSQERDKDQPEEPRKKDDHACDALRYMVMSKPRPTRDAAELGDPDRGARDRDYSAGVIDKVF